jgi:hypothetical protein
VGGPALRRPRVHRDRPVRSRAQALHEEASEVLDTLGAPQLGAEVGLLDNHDRATRPAFTVPLPPPPAELRIDPVHGWLVSLEPGREVVARAPPLFEATWRSTVPLPACDAQAVRWEEDTFALYCAGSGHVDRVDLATGAATRVTALEGHPPTVDAPDDTDLPFQGRPDGCALGSFPFRRPSADARRVIPAYGTGRHHRVDSGSKVLWYTATRSPADRV